MKTIRFRDHFEIKAPEQVTRLDTKQKIKMIDSYLSGINTLRVTVAGTHAGRITRNNALYLPAKMSNGIKSMLSREDGGTSAFGKPVLINHNRAAGNVPDMSRDPIGRIREAEYVSLLNQYDKSNVAPVIRDAEIVRPDWQYIDMVDVLMKDGILYKKDFQGLGYAKVVMEISDEKAIKKFLDGRYCTVSTSATSNRAVCSVCKEDWADLGEPCDHSPGHWYDSDGNSDGSDQKCFLIAGDLAYEEISTATKPADEEAIVLEMEGDVKTPSVYTSKLNDSYQPYEIMAGINFKDSFDPEGGHNMDREELVNKLKEAFENHSESLNDLSEDITDEVLTDLVTKLEDELTEEDFCVALNITKEEVSPEDTSSEDNTNEDPDPKVEDKLDFGDSINRALEAGKITEEEALALHEVVTKTAEIEVEDKTEELPEAPAVVESIVNEDAITTREQLQEVVQSMIADSLSKQEPQECPECKDTSQKIVSMSEQRDKLATELEAVRSELEEAREETDMLIKQLSDSLNNEKMAVSRNIAFMHRINDAAGSFEDICNEMSSKSLKDLKNLHKELHDNFDFANIRGKSDKSLDLPEEIKDPTLAVNDEHNSNPGNDERIKKVVKRYNEIKVDSKNMANAYLLDMKERKFISKDFNIEDYLKEDNE